MRRIFIGDIQGCREELEELLERTRFDPAADRLHPVGDLVNRGPDSLGTLRLLRSLEARPVLGNHDLHLLECARGQRKRGGRDTLDAVLDAEDSQELLRWLAAQPFLRVFSDVFLVHAALHPKWKDPERELAFLDPHEPSAAARFCVSTRYCDPKGNVPERDATPPGAPFRPWHEFYEPARHGGRRVVFGHWAARGLQLEAHVMGLDSGCVWGNELTAWIAEEDRLVQVEARRAYAAVR